jgi:hypothetical protein
MNPVGPRQFVADAGLAGAGLPHDRASRQAAQHALIELKSAFLTACAALRGHEGEWLRAQVLLADDPVDLWLLRGPVLDALAADSGTRALRKLVRRSLAALFPQQDLASGFASL